MTRAEAEDAGLLAEAIDEVEEALAREASHRGRQGNLSFFAFTATPKARTLEMFGVLNQDTGLYDPFHLYTMRQAIEEGFILDVLINYTTYKTIWRIEKAIREDPRYEPGKAPVRTPPIPPLRRLRLRETVGHRNRLAGPPQLETGNWKSLVVGRRLTN